MKKEGKLVLLVVISVLIAGMHYSFAMLPDGGASTDSPTPIPGLIWTEGTTGCSCTSLTGDAHCTSTGTLDWDTSKTRCEKTSTVCGSYTADNNKPINCYCTKDPPVAICVETDSYSFDYGEPCASKCAGSEGIQCKCEYDPTAFDPNPSPILCGLKLCDVDGSTTLMEDSDGQCLDICLRCNSPSSRSCPSGYICNPSTGVCETSDDDSFPGGTSTTGGYPDCLILTDLCLTGQCPAGSPTITAIPLGGHCDPTHINNCDTNHRYCPSGTCQECPTPGDTATAYNTCEPPNSFDATKRAAVCGGSAPPITNCLPPITDCLYGDGNYNCTVTPTLTPDGSRCENILTECRTTPNCPYGQQQPTCDTATLTPEYSQCVCKGKRADVVYSDGSACKQGWYYGKISADSECNDCFYNSNCPNEGDSA